jgi:hypothetical protein
MNKSYILKTLQLLPYHFFHLNPCYHDDGATEQQTTDVLLLYKTKVYQTMKREDNQCNVLPPKFGIQNLRMNFKIERGGTGSSPQTPAH